MDYNSEWFYKSIQQRKVMSTMATAMELSKSVENLGLGSWKSIETGM